MALIHDRKNLLNWYRENHRPLPWRKNRDPYRIWISEVMLQQTTVTAVIPYYEKFTSRFTNLKSLALAKEQEVLQLWAGLGYYSRARNLHKAAKMLLTDGFPQTHPELIRYPGFGPYTARAVTSLAFGENTGVLDGNVIRVLSRKHGQSVEWWTSRGREQLQTLADQMVDQTPSHEMNQALMELGACLCTPTQPKCLLCPWQKSCVALRANTIHLLPLSKPRPSKEIWLWQAQWIERRGRILMVENDYAPFLRKQWILPGQVKKLRQPPRGHAFVHHITHRKIYTVITNHKANLTLSKSKWATPQQALQWNPSSLIRKVINNRKTRP